MDRLKKISLIVITASLTSVACLFLFVLGAGYYLVVRDPIRASSAVAVLSGGGIERMDHASDLIREDYAKRLIITDTGTIDPTTGVKVSRIMEDQAAQRGVRKVFIHITDGIAETTRDEAIAIKTLALEKDWQRIIVVTDSFHSRRTKIIFSDLFRETGIQIAVNPVDAVGYWYHPATWWMESQPREATIYEYIALISYKLGIYQENL